MRARRSGEPRAAARARGNAAGALRQGVYLTVDELKGRRNDRERPDLDRGGHGRLPESAGPSRPAPLPKRKPRQPGPVPVGLASLRERAVTLCLTLRRPWRDRLANTAIGRSRAAPPWCTCSNAIRSRVRRRAGSPSSIRVAWSASAVPLERASHVLGGRGSRGRPSRAPVRATRRSPSDRSSGCWTCAASGGDAPPQDVRELGRPPVQVAYERRSSISDGVRFTVTGEPVTEARLAAIRRTGAEATPRCGTSEAGLHRERLPVARGVRRAPPLPGSATPSSSPDRVSSTG